MTQVSLSKPDTCDHCGRTGLGQGRLCRPPGSNGRPFCHQLVTRFAHPTPCACTDRTTVTALIVSKRATSRG